MSTGPLDQGTGTGTQAGPAWIVVPARVIAVVIVLPLRLVYDLLRLAGRGLKRTTLWIGRMLGAIYMAVLHPVIRGVGVIARWIYSAVLTPIGRFLDLIIVRPIAALCRGIGWVLKHVGLGLLFLADVLIATPAKVLWRYVLRPPLLGLAWLARMFAGALAWAWRMLGILFYWIARILFVIPALVVYRYLLRPVGLTIAAAWRFSGRCLRWLWSNLVVAPTRVPVRWVRRSVLSPIRQTMRDVRLQFRRAFGRPPR